MSDTNETGNMDDKRVYRIEYEYPPLRAINVQDVKTDAGFTNEEVGEAFKIHLGGNAKIRKVTDITSRYE